jgi:hypothetical protein
MHFPGQQCTAALLMVQPIVAGLALWPWIASRWLHEPARNASPLRAWSGIGFGPDPRFLVAASRNVCCERTTLQTGE